MKRKLVPFLFISDLSLFLLHLLLHLIELLKSKLWFSFSHKLSAMHMKTAMASVDLSGKLCYLLLFGYLYPWWAVYQSWALILSSPAAEGITAIVVPTPLRKIPGAWAERARVKPLACLNSEIFPRIFADFSKQSDAGTCTLNGVRATQQGLLW